MVARELVAVIVGLGQWLLDYGSGCRANKNGVWSNIGGRSSFCVWLSMRGG